MLIIIKEAVNVISKDFNTDNNNMSIKQYINNSDMTIANHNNNDSHKNNSCKYSND